MNHSIDQRTFTITATVESEITESIIWKRLDQASSKEKGTSKLEEARSSNAEEEKYSKSEENKNERIKKYLRQRLSKEFTKFFSMKFLTEEKDSLFFFEITDIQIESNTLQIHIKAMSRFFEYISLDVDLAALTISRWLPDIFASLLQSGRGEFESHVHWATKFNLTKNRNKPKRRFTSYVDDWLKILLKASTIIARGYLMSSPFILSHLITMNEATINKQIRWIVESSNRPVQVNIEQESCSCGFCDRCRPNCLPC